MASLHVKTIKSLHRRRDGIGHNLEGPVAGDSLERLPNGIGQQVFVLNDVRFSGDGIK